MTIEYEAPEFKKPDEVIIGQVQECKMCGALTTDIGQHSAWHIALFDAIARAMFG